MATYLNNFKSATPTENQAETICHVIRASITHLCGPDYHHDPEIMKDWLSNKTPRNVALWINSVDNHSCAVVDIATKQVAGFALMNSEGDILLNYVAPNHTKKGIGKMLLSTLEATAKALGLSALSVTSTVTAKSFYEKAGFIKNGTPEYVGNVLGDFPLIKYLD